MKRTLERALITIGVALIVIAVLLPIFLVPRLRVIPLGTVSDTVTEVHDGALLNSSQLSKNESTPGRRNDPRCKVETDEEERDLPVRCFINDKAPTQSKRHAEVEGSTNGKITTFQIGTTLLRDDHEGPKNPINATLNCITVDRSTTYLIDDPISSVATDAPQGGLNTKPSMFTRPGIQYQFLFGVEKKSYPYLDVQAMCNFGIGFVGGETQDGVKVYRYSATVSPQNPYESLTERFTCNGHKLTKVDKSSLTSMRLNFPTHKWGLEGGGDVELDHHCTNIHTVRVEPTSGVTIDDAEEMLMYYTKNDEEAEGIASEADREKEAKKRNRIAMKYTAQRDEGSKGCQMGRAKGVRESLTIGGTIAPWVLGALGLVFIAIGSRVHSRSA